MSSTSKKILVTAGLPYANGPLHLGHMLEYLQTDIWVRFQKMMGHTCFYFCGSDTHGTPIMLNAKKEGLSPEEFAQKWHENHKEVFKDFDVDFTNYHTTHSSENQKLLEYFYKTIKEKNYIEKKTIEQFYCEHDEIFLPDRFLKGNCPKCQAPHQYGDSCEKCGAHYPSTDMKEAYCDLCKNKPILKKSDHLFFKLKEFRSFLMEWIPQHTQKEVSNKLKEWLDSELKDWNISRDKPYFGYPIPDEKDKYFYVWMDAPIGYISATENWCKKHQKSLKDYWQSPDTEIYHFIGQDIISFHLLFWPSMLKATRYNTPAQVFVHGFLTVNGEKMSKSRGTFIQARTYLNHLDPVYLRYYFASKLTDSIENIDFGFEDFTNRINSELVGKITNLASRGAQMLLKKLDGQLTKPTQEGEKLIEKNQKASLKIQEHYEKRQFSKVISDIRSLAEEANRYFDQKKPWKLIETDPEKTQQILTDTLNIFRLLSIYLKPVLPSYVAKVEKLFQENPYTWNSAKTVLKEKNLNPFSHLVQKVDIKTIEKIQEEAKTSFQS